MRIVVTDRDIIQAAVDKADPDKLTCTSCPVAHSLARRGFRGARVYQDSIMWYTDEGLRTIPTPPVAAEWIEKYDNLHHVGPFSFELAVTL